MACWNSPYWISENRPVSDRSVAPEQCDVSNQESAKTLHIALGRVRRTLPTATPVLIASQNSNCLAESYKCAVHSTDYSKRSSQARVSFSSAYTKDSYGARVACSIPTSHVRLAQMYRSRSRPITSWASSCVAERVSSSWSKPRSPAKAQQVLVSG